jgi:hypothetical protein
LMQGLLATQSTPAGRTKFSLWASEHASVLGNRYENELLRRIRGRVA